MPDFSLEDSLADAAALLVCGVDEAGRGPLAGPVVAGAVMIADRGALAADLRDGLDDSKRLTARRRDFLFERLHEEAAAGRLWFGVGLATAAEIDNINILRATFQAMVRAVAAAEASAGHPAGHALIDGNRPPPLSCPHTCVVGGDGRSLSIAAASIIAKVTRDRLMLELAGQFPGYGWERNQGYPTAEHRDAVRRLGPTPHHRMTFAGSRG